MSPLLFVIAAEAYGWQLYQGSEQRYWFARWDDALETADIMAATAHEQRGVTTAVMVNISGRGTLMVSRHG
ncbi:MAG: hypothetical protein ABW178_10180 [Pseudoxanthomonas sp.]